MVDEQRTGRSLVEHWARAAAKGLMPKASAQTMAVSCRRVLEIEQDWKHVDVLALDIEDFIRRFKNLKALWTTKRAVWRHTRAGFRRGVLSYRAFLSDPGKWRFESRMKKTSTSKPKDHQSDGGDTATDTSQPEAGLQKYMYPFRQSVLATLTIPQDATAAEIRRLVAWAQTLAVDYEGE